MKNIKIYIKTILLSIPITLIYLLMFTSLHYFGIMPYNVLKILSLIFTIIIFILMGINVSRTIRNKGYINGIIVGVIYVIILILLSLILRENLTIKSLVYYVVLIASSTVGGIAGINIKLFNKKNYVK
ncbi:MAG: TIGR04086 family membrane protein [Bacilli bacterium]